MIAKAIEKVESLVRGTLGKETITLKNGRNIYFMNGNKIAADAENRPDALHLHTLTALVDYVRETFASGDPAVMRWKPDMIVVDSEQFVTLYAAMQGIDYDRPVLATVDPLSAFGFKFNAFQSVESFIIGLQACFAPDKNRNDIIDAVAGIKLDDSVSLKDDGVCQMATQRRGMQLEKQVQLPNPVSLIPYRTFSEIEQPASNFILRASDRHGEPEIGLFEADGGAWKNDAALLIKGYLTKELNNLDVQILG